MAKPRTKATGKEIKSEQVLARFTPTEREVLRKVAAAESRTVADFVRLAALDRAHARRNPSLPGVSK
jgi:uncharacterized protein (DUF1778 family)